MFTKSRPAPSNAALGVLYQLAYISSGAAVGVGVLCAEERRRQTKLVQRIADNARIIRQSPRYVHGGAAAFVASRDAGLEEAGYGTNRWTPEEFGGRKMKGLGDVLNGDAVTGPEIPSVVADGYAWISTEDSVQKRSRRKRRDTPRLAQNEYTRTFESQNEKNPASAPSAKYKSSSQRLHPHKALATSQINYVPRKDRFYVSPFSPGPAKSKRQDELVQYRPDFATAYAWKHNGNGYAIRDAGSGSVSTGGRSHHTHVSNEMIASDVQLFMKWTSESGEQLTESKSLSTMHHCASQLLVLACQCGSLDDIRSLFKWKAASGTWDSATLCANVPNLAARIDHKALLHFYTEVFSAPGFCFVPPATRLSQVLDVLGHVLRWDLDMTRSQRSETLLGPFVKTFNPDSVSDVTSIKCKSLLVSLQAAKAVELFLAVACADTAILAGSKASVRNTQEHLMDELFSAVVKDKDLTLCKELLIHRRGRADFIPTSWAFGEQLNKFVLACGREKSYEPVRDMFFRQKIIGHLEIVSVMREESRAVLAIACSIDGDSVGNFGTLYRSLSIQNRQEVEQYGLAAALKATWEAGHNMKAVQAHYSRLVGQLRAVEATDAKTQIDLALVEIHILANQYDHAVNAIGQIHESDAVNANTISLSAMIFAQRQAWSHLAQLLNLKATWSKVALDVASTDRFNAVLRLYAKRYNATDTWKLLNRLMERYQLVPNRTTNDILLQCMVSSRQIGLIPHWLRSLKRRGLDFDFDGHTAAALMRRYYRDLRPPHALLMALCRDLVRLSPTLNKRPFLVVIREAIGFDLRETSGQNAMYLREHAHTRLGLVEAAVNEIPSPGYSWNQKLYFGDPKAALKEDLEFDNDADRVEFINDSRQSEWGAKDQEPQDPIDSPQNMHAADLQSIGQSTVQTSFENLRPVFEKQPNAEVQLTAGQPRSGATVRDMILAMSLGDFDRVLAMYEKCLDPTGIPASPLCLEVAIEASLRRSSSKLRQGVIPTTEAEEILSRAHNAGMNVQCAVGPLLIHKMKYFNSTDRLDALKLRTAVLEYYKSNHESGYPVRHKVGVQAADTLVRAQKAQYGLEILHWIWNSDAAKDQFLDIVTMTVFLRAYTVLKSLGGIRWVLTKVLNSDMRIDHKFIAQLKFSLRKLTEPVKPKIGLIGDRHTKNPHVIRRELGPYLAMCNKKRSIQRRERMIFGMRLVKMLARVSRADKVGDGYEGALHSGEISRKELSESNPSIEQETPRDPMVSKALGRPTRGDFFGSEFTKQRRATPYGPFTTTTSFPSEKRTTKLGLNNSSRERNGSEQPIVDADLLRKYQFHADQNPPLPSDPTATYRLKASSRASERTRPRPGRIRFAQMLDRIRCEKFDRQQGLRAMERKRLREAQEQMGIDGRGEGLARHDGIATS